MNYIELERQELPFEVAEEIKLLRTNLQFCGSDKQVIMLTSCVSGEGKSTLSVRIARSFAELDKRVLLIDADLRKSVLEKRVVDGQIKAGLSHYLSGQCTLDEALYSTETENLDVIPAGIVPPNPSELVASTAFAKLIQLARTRYDYVIVDCPPLGLVVDAAVIAACCDGSVLAIEAGHVKYRFAKDVARKLQNAQCPVLGVVLNKVNRRSSRYGSYYGYGYGKSYGYEAYY